MSKLSDLIVACNCSVTITSTALIHCTCSWHNNVGESEAAFYPYPAISKIED